MNSRHSAPLPSQWPVLRWLVVVLTLFILMLGIQFWWGTGGWLELQEVERRVAEQAAINAPLVERNDRLAAEIADLKEGLEAIEERARSDLGMVREGEQFFWVPGAAAEVYQALPDTAGAAMAPSDFSEGAR